ncbi:hypothetical protein MAM1_0192d07697 [Mucor ambiguus]|uniref:Uncharacterized protein n=1 Tax=Mucor ambiguus TaxID=91626 RepID=A0A0C9LWA6_9FUNG|nr:hypothetical protein MAM1_0192d07697 [Mucor ambiguus]
MHPLVHSPTQTTLKSKWHSFKTWFTPDLTKRRPSQCSTTSTTSTASTNSTAMSCCCHQEDSLFIPSHTKRPSLTGSEGLGIVVDKCMSPFRRRPSNASSELSTMDTQKEIEKVYELYNLAMDELNYAEDSRGSPYYSGDRIAAREAIENCEESYTLLLMQTEQQNDDHLKSTIGFKISTLRSKYESLPLQDDQLSF